MMGEKTVFEMALAFPPFSPLLPFEKTLCCELLHHAHMEEPCNSVRMENLLLLFPGRLLMMRYIYIYPDQEQSPSLPLTYFTSSSLGEV
jgi:hypothetical protein